MAWNREFVSGITIFGVSGLLLNNNKIPYDRVTDSNGNQYDLFGVVISGPMLGNRLDPTVSYMGYWFAWAAFYPGLDIR
jgi:hypothetical protein